MPPRMGDEAVFEPIQRRQLIQPGLSRWSVVVLVGAGVVEVAVAGVGVGVGKHAGRHPQLEVFPHFVESAWGAVSGLLPVRFPRPLAEPAVRLSPQRALHGSAVGWFRQ